MKNKIPNKQIGWSEQSNMIYDVLREWNALNNELYLKTCCTTDTTTTDGPTPPPPTTTSTSTSSTSTTSTTTTTPPCCTAGTLEVNVVSSGITVTGINIDDLDGWYDVGSIGFPVDNTVSPRTAVLFSNADGALNIIVDNDDLDNDHYLYVYFNCVQVGSCCVIPSRSTGHVCSFPGFPISSYETDCIKIEVTNISCT